MRKFSTKANWRVPNRVRKSSKVAGYDRVGRSLVGKYQDKVFQSGK
jgi:hypothetical protein